MMQIKNRIDNPSQPQTPQIDAAGMRIYKFQNPIPIDDTSTHLSAVTSTLAANNLQALPEHPSKL
jgi:hypothetical protein